MIDVNRTNIILEIDKDYIKFIGTGKGLNNIEIKNMWDLLRKNHTEYRSIGVFGLGCRM